MGKPPVREEPSGAPPATEEPPVREGPPGDPLLAMRQLLGPPLPAGGFSQVMKKGAPLTEADLCLSLLPLYSDPRANSIKTPRGSRDRVLQKTEDNNAGFKEEET